MVAGDRLGMEPAIGGIEVFRSAQRAHGKRCHGCFLTVIGQMANDGESRAAVRTVDQGIVFSM